MKEQKIPHHFLLAFLVILAWLLIAKEQYEYNYNFPEIWGMSMFTLFVASFVLFFVYLVNFWIAKRFSVNSVIKQFAIFTILCWILLLIGETVGYHYFNIHNLNTAQYPGLPILDSMHAPHWMQIAYFSIGPIYFITCLLLNLENRKPKTIEVENESTQST